MALSTKLRNVAGRFRSRDQQGMGYATLYFDDFIALSLGC